MHTLGRPLAVLLYESGPTFGAPVYYAFETRREHEAPRGRAGGRASESIPKLVLQMHNTRGASKVSLMRLLFPAWIE